MKSKSKKQKFDQLKNIAADLLLDIAVFWLPKKYQPAARFAITVTLVIVLGVSTCAGVVSVFIPNANTTTIINHQQVLGASSGPVIKTDFKDKENWENLDKFIVESEDPLVVGLPPDSRGNIAFYKKEIGSKFAASFKCIPLNAEKANIVFQFGSNFRLIVGENNLRAISLEQNMIAPDVPGKWVKIVDDERGRTQRFIGGDGFQAFSEVEIKITSIPTLSTQLKLTVELTYKPAHDQLGGADQTAVYNYSLDTIVSSEDIRGRLGFGLIDETKSGTLRIQPVNLMAEKYDLE